MGEDWLERREIVVEQEKRVNERQPKQDASSPEDPLRLAELLFSLSRRHALPFSVVAVGLDDRPHDPQSTLSGVASPPEPGAAARLEAGVTAELRRTDLLARWGRAGRYVVFCPYTSPEGAKELSRRLRTRGRGLAIRAGSASFREDALTLQDLIDNAWRRAIGPRPAGDDDAGPRPGAPIQLMRRPVREQVRPSWRRRASQRIKRWFDLAVVFGTAPFWLPVMGLVALAIKLSEPSAPVLFRQMRTGRGGRRFPMYKFRTMVPDAEAMKEKLRHLNQLQWPDFKIERDPRITRIGRLLRKTSLDELPQVWNVVKGDMSLVGPRPTSFAPETYEPWQTARLDVVPGLTGLWQVEGRTRTEFDERLRLDLEYIERQSLSYDIRILWRTVSALLQMRGGY